LGFEKPAVFIFGIWWAVDLTPALYLHFEYWLINKGEQFEITSGEVIKNKGNVETRYKSENIKEIVVYKSASMDKGGIPYFAFESYYYARVVLTSGDEFVLTRLLMPKLEEVIKHLTGVKFVRKKRLFCTVFWK